MIDLKRIVIFIGDANNFGHTRTTMSYISCFLRLGTEVFVYCRSFDTILHEEYDENINVTFYKSLTELTKIIKLKKIHYGLKVDYDLSPIIQLLCKIYKIKLLSLYCTLVNKFRYYNEKSCVVISKEIGESIRNLRNDSLIYLITNRVSKEKLVYGKLEQSLDISATNVIRITQFSNHYQQSNLRLVDDFCKISRRYKLWLVGSGDKGNIGVLNDIIKKKQINCTVKDVNSRNLDNYILDADIVVGTGRTAIDALYFRKPLIVPNFEGSGMYVILDNNNIFNLIENNLSGRNFNKSYSFTLSECIAITETDNFKNFINSNYYKIFLNNYSDENLEKKLIINMFNYVDSCYLSFIYRIFKYAIVKYLVKFKYAFK